MDLFDELRKYRTGYDTEGNSQFSIPLKPDEDGMIGRECPNELCAPKYFKVRTENPEEDESGVFNPNLTCPYCGNHSGMQEFHTRAQIDWLEAMVMRDAEKGVVRELRKIFAPLNQTRGGLIDIKVEVKASLLPTVRMYVEEKLKQKTTCDKCAHRYAVYGVSFHCPFCGQGAIQAHLRKSVQTARVLASEAERIGREHGAAAEERMLGNAYEDVVSLFEGFLRRIYRYAVERKYGPKHAGKLLRTVRTNFQRPGGAAEFFERDLQVRLFDEIEDEDLTSLEGVFCKRHVLTHNLGLVDGKYLDQAKAWQREGEEVPLDAKEVEEGVLVVERVVSSAAEDLGL